MGFFRKKAAPRYGSLMLRKHADDAKNYAGIEILSTDGAYTIPTSTVKRGVEEGWITYPDGYSVVHRPGGNRLDPWKVTHTFTHTPALCFHTIDGPVQFRVTHQPDKYVDGRPTTDDDVERSDAYVDWYYRAELMNG